jgi:hypothetical protein
MEHRLTAKSRCWRLLLKYFFLSCLNDDHEHAALQSVVVLVSSR